MRVLIAEDHRLFAQALRLSLSKNGVDVVGIAADGIEAAALVDELEPDLVLLDLQMPRLASFEVVGRLRTVNRPTGFAILTAKKSPQALRWRSARLSAIAFLSKNQSIEDIAHSLPLVAAFTAKAAR